MKRRRCQGLFTLFVPRLPESVLRSGKEFEICHIPGSVNISMADPDGILGALKADAETVLICHHGVRSGRLGRYLEDKGLARITNLDGGVAAWAETVDQEMARY